MHKRFLIAATVTMAFGSASSAAVVFSDGFEGDAPGIGLTSLTNFSVTGTVDVVGPANPYGIAAPSNVVDLDGTPGPGAISNGTFSFDANRRVTLTFVLGGAQRGSVGDDFFAGFQFASATQLNNYTLGGAFGNFNAGSYNTSAISTSSFIAGTAPFASYTLAFTSGNAGTLSFNIGSSSADNIGPLLDSVSLDISAVPEPATWTLMVFGFGLVGLGLRRRPRSVAA